MMVGTGSVTSHITQLGEGDRGYLIVGQVDLRQQVAREHLLREELKVVVLEVDNPQTNHPLQGTVNNGDTRHI